MANARSGLTLGLQIVGFAVGAFIGGPIGAGIGGALGALSGYFIGGAIDGPPDPLVSEGGRLDDIQFLTSTEGAPIARVFGRARIAGEVIWRTKFLERVVETTTPGEGKGTPTAPDQVRRDYLYSVSLAIGLCEGEIDRIGRIWADGKPLIILDPEGVRVYNGTETQEADPLIARIQGRDVPAFRGLAYIVFEDLELADFGNRIPQINVEVIRRLVPEVLGAQITGTNIAPTDSEFGLGTGPVARMTGDEGQYAPENTINPDGETDWICAIDQLREDLEFVDNVILEVPFYGTSIEAAECEIMPGVMTRDKSTFPRAWQIMQETRATARVVAPYGGTPDDRSIREAIVDLRRRGFRVMIRPKLLIDVDGYPEASEITAAAAAQVNTFFTRAAGYRRFVLHLAALAASTDQVLPSARSVDFLIGSRLGGLTHNSAAAVRNAAVAQLRTLAAQVRGVLPQAALSYEADWTEYGAFLYGAGGVDFTLDDLWSDPNIGFIAIANFAPMSNWPHDRGTGAGQARMIYDLAYLKSQIEGGEHYDYLYADAAARAADARTAIIDPQGFHEAWAFRQKDFRRWHGQAHHNRSSAGIRSSAATSWVPGSKQIVFTQLGCHAIDLGANSPELIAQPGQETERPIGSDGSRDDYIQRRVIEALSDFWSDQANNPRTDDDDADDGFVSERMFFNQWDRRPFPFYPNRADVWPDSLHYQDGRTLTGRVNSSTASVAIREVLERAGITDLELDDANGVIEGYVINGVVAPRMALEPILAANFLALSESGGIVRAVDKRLLDVIDIPADDILERSDEETGNSWQITRTQETDLPRAVKLSYFDAEGDYEQAVAEARRLGTISERILNISLPLIMTPARAQALADATLNEQWMARERISFTLSPSWLALEPGDVIRMALGGQKHIMRITEITDGDGRSIQAVIVDSDIYRPPRAHSRFAQLAEGRPAGAPLVELIDCPRLRDDDADNPYVAAYMRPWPGDIAIFKSASLSNYRLAARLSTAAVMGRTATPLSRGPFNIWDRDNVFEVSLLEGSLSSASERAVLNGANSLLIKIGIEQWELLSFAHAEITDDGTYRLSQLLRGLRGTEGNVIDPIPAQSRVILVSSALSQLPVRDEERLTPLNWLIGPARDMMSAATYRIENRAFALNALRPYAPASSHAYYDRFSNLIITWARRTRVEGDNWQSINAPLNESREVYNADIINIFGEVIRSIVSTEPLAVYTRESQVRDFLHGDLPAGLEALIYQVSETYGRGAFARQRLTPIT